MKDDTGKNNYIGEIYAEDVYAYVNVSAAKAYREPGITGALKAHKAGCVSFYWPAALTETLWYAYRGMIKEAVFFDAVSMILGGIILHYSRKACFILFVFFAILKGFLAVPLYYIRIKDAVEKRGLLMRSSQEIPEIAESLSKEGKPSVPRAVLYLFLKCFAAICLDSILFTVFCILEK